MIPKTKEDLQRTVDEQWEKIVKLEQRALDEQSAFDKMEHLYLQEQEGFRVLERKFGQESVMLDEQRRLMRISNRKLVELEKTISSLHENEEELIGILLRYGNHARTCKINQGGNYYMEPVECDCGWEREKIALKLIEKYNEQYG